MLNRWFPIFILLALSLTLCAQNPDAWCDPSPHRAQFVPVEPNVQLEVLDWGGSGRPLILLTGLGGTAARLRRFRAEAPKHGTCVRDYAARIGRLQRPGGGLWSGPAWG